MPSPAEGMSGLSQDIGIAIDAHQFSAESPSVKTGLAAGTGVWQTSRKPSWRSVQNWLAQQGGALLACVLRLRSHAQAVRPKDATAQLRAAKEAEPLSAQCVTRRDRSAARSKRTVV